MKRIKIQERQHTILVSDNELHTIFDSLMDTFVHENGNRLCARESALLDSIRDYLDDII